MKLVKKVAMALATVPFLAGSLGLGAAAPTQAATATLSGMFGSSPKYNGISTGGRSLCPCRPILYNSLPGLLPTASGVWALDQWVSTTPGSKTVIAYSKGTHSALGWIRENADEMSAHTVRFVLLAAPETPGNGGWRVGHNLGNGLPATGNFGNVSFVVRQYDKVADAPQDPFNFLAAINASMSTHLEGYDELDLDKPDAIYIDPKTGARTLYFRTDVLPLLAWTEWFATDEQIAQWDGLLRPLIEAAYDRPVDIPDRGPASPRADRTVTVPVVATPPVLDEEVGPAVSTDTDTDTGTDPIAVSAVQQDAEAQVTSARTAVRHSGRDMPEAADADVIDAPVTPAEPAVPAEDPAEDLGEDLGVVLVEELADEDSGHGPDDTDPAPGSSVTAASEAGGGSVSRASSRDSGARERRAG
ncbi:PE-PPE domain-containing protein [Mycolicibacterium vaccae]|uniref:PE-PPE domain-containing protein n=1 Tax=Mycolicibacterium vaccae TaxID=1810 RepID=UPI003D050EFB